MKLSAILFLSLFIIGCGNAKESTKREAESSEKKEEKKEETVAKKGILTQDWNKYRDTDSYNILNCSIEGNVLELQVSYSGGCKKHDFDLIGSVFLMKSLPPRRGIKLFHQANGDDCRELISERLYFDISEFAYVNGEIVLNLEHYKEAIHYIKK